MPDKQTEAQIKDTLSQKGVRNNSIIISNLFLEEYGNIIRNGKELYLYNGKIYELIDNSYFEKLFKKFLVKYNATCLWKMQRIKEVKLSIYADNEIKHTDIDDYNNLICFNNGIFDFKTKKLVPHSPDYYFTTMIDVDYDKEQTDAPVFTKFLKKTFTLDNGDHDKETINNIIQLGGYLLYPENRMESMFVCLGSGANGKGVLFQVFKMFFAKENVSYMNLETICEDSRERTPIIGSRLNITTETKGTKLDVEELKKIISSEEIVVKRKHQDPIDYRPKIKIIISSNTLPYFNDTSFGTDRRLIVFSFLNQFVTKHHYDNEPNPEKKRIFIKDDKKTLLKSLKDEKSAILNMFLRGLNVLEKNNWEISLSENNVKSMKDYKLATDTFGSFVKEFYMVDEDDNCEGVTPNDILKYYREWYRENVKDVTPNFSVNLIGRRIKEIYRMDPIKRAYTNEGRLSYYKLKRKSHVDSLKEDLPESASVEGVPGDGGGSENDADRVHNTEIQRDLFNSEATPKDGENGETGTQAPTEIPQS